MNPKVLLSICLIGIMVDFTVSRYTEVNDNFPRRFMEDNMDLNGHESLYPSVRIANCKEALQSLPDDAAEYLCLALDDMSNYGMS